MDARAVAKRVSCCFQFNDAELKMINDPKFMPNQRSLNLAKVIQDKGKAKEVYRMLRCLYYVQDNPQGCSYN